MNIISDKKLPKNQLELIIEVPLDELDKYLKQAAQKISRRKKIAGFRPGRTPYEIIKRQFGEMTIYQETLDPLIKETLLNAIERKKLEIVGKPQIDVEKLAPGNAIVYRAIVALLPKVKIKNYKNIKIKPKKIEVDEEKIKKTLNQLQKMRAEESVADKKIEIGDKAIVDFSVYLDKIAVDGGQYKDYPIYLGENFFIRGFEEKLVGMKKGEEKEFELKFPKEYFQKNLAGKLGEFKIKIKEVFRIEKPKINDKFAKTLNFENVEILKEQIKKSVEKEEKFQDEQRIEMEIFDQIIRQSEFDEFPPILIEGELDKMIAELKNNIARQGVKFDDYLNNLKITVENLRKDSVPRAKKRLQISLILREIAILEKINIAEWEIEKEIEHLLKIYTDKEEIKNINSDSYKLYLKNMLTNRRVVEKLKEWNIK